MIELLDFKTGMILIGALSVIAIYRFFFQRKSPEEQELEREYNDILNLDKYKVKGQW